MTMSGVPIILERVSSTSAAGTLPAAEPRFAPVQAGAYGPCDGSRTAAVGSRPRRDDRGRETLAGIAIFRELQLEDAEALSRRCRWRRYGPGQTILQRQDEGRDVFFVVRGRVCAIHHSASGREIRICDLPAGEMFGEFAAIDGEPRSADIVSVTDTLIASMPVDVYWDVLRRYESVWVATMRGLTRTIRSQLRRVIELSTLPVRSRVHAELLRLARIAPPGPGPTSAVIGPAPTHAEIASRISSHREAVTRELNALTRAKLIEKRGGVLVIRDIVALARLLEDAVEEPCRAIHWHNGSGGIAAKPDH